MKLHTVKVASIILAVFLLTGCAPDNNRNTGFSRVNPYSSEGIDIDAAQANNSEIQTPMTWEQTMEFGSLVFTVDSVQLIINADETGDGGFGEHSEIVIYNGEYDELASNNWQEYGSLYETIYHYPDYLDATGAFLEGTCMIALDISVESRDATNQWTNTNTGKVETRYGNPYIFKADSILYLIDQAEKASDGSYSGVPAGFFSGYDLCAEHPMVYELKPGETTSFRIGFLIGNRKDGTNRVYSDLAVSTQSYSLDDDVVWFPLQLEEEG